MPTPEHERDEAMPSDLGERKEVIPQEPESDFASTLLKKDGCLIPKQH